MKACNAMLLPNYSPAIYLLDIYKLSWRLFQPYFAKSSPEKNCAEAETFPEEADETDLSNIESGGHKVTVRTSRDGQQLSKRHSILRAYGVHHARDVVAQSPTPVCVVAIRHRLLANTSRLFSVFSLALPPGGLGLEDPNLSFQQIRVWCSPSVPCSNEEFAKRTGKTLGAFGGHFIEP